MAPRRIDAIIAGVNKAGTTSLFVSLSTHPDVAPSSIKETRYFLPARYGEPLPPTAQWDAYFADAGDRPVHLEATPSYFYGGAAVAQAMRERLAPVLHHPLAVPAHDQRAQQDAQHHMQQQQRHAPQVAQRAHQVVLGGGGSVDAHQSISLAGANAQRSSWVSGSDGERFTVRSTKLELTSATPAAFNR